MSAVLFFMVAGATVYGAATGRLAAVSQAALEAGAAAIDTTLGLMGGFLFFGGLIAVLERAGAVRALVCALKSPLRRLFGEQVSEEALAAITLNLSANMLGLGNAATPMGLRAAKLLNAAGERAAPPALCLLLVMNATSVQVMPTSVIALRSAAGSAHPEAIFWPSLIASAVSTLAGVAACKLLERKGRA